jgi:hypothetical protein
MAGIDQEKVVEFLLALRATGGELDDEVAYKWSEASAIRDTFSRMLIERTSDGESWFSAYRLKKVSWANKNITVLNRDSLRELQFQSYDDVINFMEELLKSVGYAAERRSTHSLIRQVKPEQLLADASYMTSLLLSEYEWENSMKFFQSKGKEFGPAKYKIVDDVAFTPVGGVRRRNISQREFDELQGDNIRQSVMDSMVKAQRPSREEAERPVQQKLDFDDVSSSEATPVKGSAASAPSTTDRLAAGLLKLAADGELTMDELSYAVKTLNTDELKKKKKHKVEEPKLKESSKSKSHSDAINVNESKPSRKTKERERTSKKAATVSKSKQSSKKVSSRATKTPDTVKRPAQQDSSDSSDSDYVPSESSSEDESSSGSSEDDSEDDDGDWDEFDEMSANGTPFSASSGEKYVTTVLQNVQIRTFDGRNRSTEEAKQWLARMIHSANISQWSDHQRVGTFANNVAGPVRYWYNQLPKKIRKDWSLLSKEFYRRYCVEVFSAQRTYYHMEQRADEKPVDYLYRFNAAGLKAGCNFTKDSSERQAHFKLFFDTASEKTMPPGIRFQKFKKLRELEEVLLQHEATQAKFKKAPSPPQQNVPKAKPAVPAPATTPRVNTVDDTPMSPSPEQQSRQRQFQGQGTRQGQGQGQKPVCEDCQKTGHTKDTCWKLVKCDHCNQQGHPTRFCRKLATQLLDLRERVKNGELTVEQLHEQLN